MEVPYCCLAVRSASLSTEQTRQKILKDSCNSLVSELMSVLSELLAIVEVVLLVLVLAVESLGGSS